MRHGGTSDDTDEVESHERSPSDRIFVVLLWLTIAAALIVGVLIVHRYNTDDDCQCEGGVVLPFGSVAASARI
jgi:hypothetical protein